MQPLRNSVCRLNRTAFEPGYCTLSLDICAPRSCAKHFQVANVERRSRTQRRRLDRYPLRLPMTSYFDFPAVQGVVTIDPDVLRHTAALFTHELRLRHNGQRYGILIWRSSGGR